MPQQEGRLGQWCAPYRLPPHSQLFSREGRREVSDRCAIKEDFVMSGQLFVIAAPSGAGKTTLTRMLLAAEPCVRLSISHTTRPPRPGEVDGQHYHFIDVPTFEAMRQHGDFLESAHVHGNYYGTSKRAIADLREGGYDVLLEIDWQGAQQVRQQFSDAVGIFILPPSVEELERRLIGRGQDSPEVIARRVAAAKAEIAHVSEFQYVIINKDLSQALADFRAILAAARLTFAAQRAKSPELFARLLA
jgi:guanylate kinase